MPTQPSTAGAMRKPNFFIIGAPKSGTTALFKYLQWHPNIFMPRKEPNFFAKDLSVKVRIAEEHEYLSLFAHATNDHLAIGEASVGYLYSHVAIKHIRQFEEKTRIIAMLRNPIDLVRSLHADFVYDLTEDVRDLEEAWYLQPLRKEGLHIPETCPEPLFLQYAEVAKLGGQVERLLNVFPREQVKFIIFDDFVSETKLAYRDVLAFLGVPSDGRTEFPKVNVAKQHRIYWLANLLARPPAPIRLAAAATRKVLGMERWTIGGLLWWANTAKGRRQPLGGRFRSELREEFREDVAKLSRLVGRDLNRWVV